MAVREWQRAQVILFVLTALALFVPISWGFVHIVTHPYSLDYSMHQRQLLWTLGPAMLVIAMGVYGVVWRWLGRPKQSGE